MTAHYSSREVSPFSTDPSLFIASSAPSCPSGRALVWVRSFSLVTNVELWGDAEVVLRPAGQR